MRVRFIALFALAGCSDYDLNTSEEPTRPGRPNKDTAEGVPVDSKPPDSAPADSDPIPNQEVPDGKIDVVLVIDDAYVYDCYHADLPVVSAGLVDALFDSGADVAMAVAIYDDYQVSGEWYAADGGVPMRLVQQLTTDRAKLKAASAGLSLDYGGDWQGSGYEALFQVGKGKGYDQDCDGAFDSSNDIKPFTASSGDAFGGKVTGTADSKVPGTGTGGGVGFRKDSKRVVILFAENGLRSAALGHDIPKGACLGVAAANGAADAILAADAKLLGVNAYEFQDIDSTLQKQLEELATLTSSRYDSDGDGKKDDLAVLSGSWDWPETAVLVDAIWQLVE